jgi:hypothetical protein
VVRGEKWMTLKRGEEFIRISGIFRPDDIAPDNTVSSTRLANAQISYSGTGTLADSQSMGWLSRFFNSAYWPLLWSRSSCPCAFASSFLRVFLQQQVCWPNALRLFPPLPVCGLTNLLDTAWW